MKDQILVVDDEKMNCSVIAQRLAQEGNTCLMANNGREALGLFYKNDFSLIISDIDMPEMNGLELLRNVKAVRPEMMFIIMTAYPEIGMAVEAIHLGATGFIPKPLDLDLMVFSSRKALEQKRMREELEAHHQKLEKLVEERTGKLNETVLVLKKSHLDSIKCISRSH